MKNHKPRKQFGQHFLHDRQTIDAIIRVIGLNIDDRVIEIGPGLGAMTNPLLEQLNHLTVIEIDRDLQSYLQTLPAATSGQLTVVCQDVLTVDWNTFGQNFRVVGNLPYNISTPLLIDLLQESQRIQDMHFMLQKEVALRLAALPHTKAYGRLSVMTQAMCKVTYLFDVPPTAFNPPPKVDSAIVRLVPLAENISLDFFKMLEWVVARSFAMRRKTLLNNLKTWITAEDLQSIGLNPGVRAEELPTAVYFKLATLMKERNINIV